MPRKKKVEPEEETVETEKIVESTQPTSETVTTEVTVELPKEEEKAEEKPKPEKSLDDKLYDIYKASPPGPISLGKLLGETGLARQFDSRTGTKMLAAAWTRLRKKRRVKGPQFTKPS